MVAPRRDRFRRLYDAQYADVAAYCRRRLPPDQVGDVVAETWTVVWQRLDDVPEGEGARPWIYGVARNLIRNQRRRHDRGDALRDALVQELSRRDQVAVAGQFESNERIAALVDALHGLRDDDREVIRLAAWEALPHADIATVLGCSPNAVAIRLHRARKRLEGRLAIDPRWRAAKDPPTTRHTGTGGHPSDGTDPADRRSQGTNR